MNLESETEVARMAICLCAELLVATAAQMSESREAAAALLGAADAMTEAQTDLATKAVKAITGLRHMVDAQATGGSA